MKTELLKFLKSQFSQSPQEIDRLIVSSFFYQNNLTQPENTFLSQYFVDENQKEELENVKSFLVIYNRLEQEFTFETLIELFEFVISPSDKVVKGAVYTPLDIREYIVEQSLNGFANELTNVKAADISCGCGGFLLTLAKQLHQQTGNSYYNIYRENIFGIDVAEYSIQRTKILLSLHAYIEGEVAREFEFNLFTGNSLTFDWRINCPEIRERDGFDVIVGNPPYVCSRNMDSVTLELIKRWEVSNTGHPDLYIPFFQIGIENLNARGILGYITVNTFLKSINGRSLREYFGEHNVNLTLVNFGGEQVFQDRNTYTCICFIKRENGMVNYVRTRSSEIRDLNLAALRTFEYADLNHHDGWNLVNDHDMSEFIKKIENTGTQFKDLYNTKNGIATLKNDVFKFLPTSLDASYYYFDDEGVERSIERGICRDIVNANKVKTPDDIDRLKEKIIFPYDEATCILSIEEITTKYPLAYAYLESKREILAERDKGKGKDKYEAWYAYGRRQSMDINAFKLFFPHICERPTFVLCLERDLLFYNGIALVSDDLQKLKVIKKILESDLFYRYIKNTTKDYASGYISMSRNYLKNFGIPALTPEEEFNFLNGPDSEQLLMQYYNLDSTQ
ncbi:HsdM family class I SAM-dependent methyltransferase [Pedobacter suwonensis]|uniref:HsdM family class I SAM-dependent methyltransferase n=1 Tax=Pedobacter suwonensis TaxID=332999 RepID=UPI0036ACBCB7